MSLHQGFWEMTAVCNGSCKHCYLGSGYRDPKELDFVGKIDVLKKFYELGIKNLVILGGEPTILPYSYEIFRVASEFPNVWVQTNGYVIEKEYFDFPFHWDFSLESANENENDFIRGIGAFERTVKNIYKASIIWGKNITIRTTLTNKTNISEMCELALRLRTNLLFMRFMPMGRGKSIEELVPTTEKMVEAYLTVFNYFSAFKKINRKVEILDPQFAFFTRWNAQYVKYFKNDKTACPAGRHRILVDHRGNYYPCNFFLKKLGNFLKDDIEKIKSKCQKFYEKWNKIGFEKSVENCPFRNVCSGGCKAMIYLTNKACYNCPVPIILEKHKDKVLKLTEFPIKLGGV